MGSESGSCGPVKLMIHAWVENKWVIAVVLIPLSQGHVCRLLLFCSWFCCCTQCWKQLLITWTCLFHSRFLSLQGAICALTGSLAHVPWIANNSTHIAALKLSLPLLVHLLPLRWQCGSHSSTPCCLILLIVQGTCACYFLVRFILSHLQLLQNVILSCMHFRQFNPEPGF